MPARIFTSDQSVTALELYAPKVDRKRSAAIELAARGQYYLAIAMFREAYESARRMPDLYRPHHIVLQDIRRAIEYHFQCEAECMIERHASEVLRLAGRAEEGEAYREKLQECMQEHARDTKVAIDLGALLRLMAYTIDTAIEEGLTLKSVLEIENLFLDALGSQGET